MDPHFSKRRKPNETTQDVAADADAVGDLSRGVSEFTQLALYMAATVAGLVTALLVARRPFFESLLRRAGGGGGASNRPRAPRAKRAASRQGASRRPVPPTREESLPLLAEAIIGNTKAAVASVFGPPRSAALRGVVKANAGSGSGYWNATTWYYPLPRNDTLAMAIEFEEESARRVEFFRAPGV